MNKSLKKVISCTLAVASFAACFASCKKTDDDADALVMDVIDLGYGTDWLYEKTFFYACERQQE